MLITAWAAPSTLLFPTQHKCAFVADTGRGIKKPTDTDFLQRPPTADGRRQPQPDQPGVPDTLAAALNADVAR